jgi:dienelactone hydrolase
MKKILTLTLLFLSISLIKSQTIEEKSLIFMGKLERNSFDSCYAMLDTVITNKIGVDVISRGWESLPRYVGEYKSHTPPRTEKKDSLDMVIITCNFEKTKMDLRLVFDDQKRIIGIFFTPPKSTASYNYPEYGKPNKFYETKLTVKTGTFELPGALCIPNNVEHPPVVILLGGSGPTDKDATIGPNKILKDLAIGLASNGIASLRYDKRTLKYASELSKNPDKIGLNEEVIDDAVSAVEILKNHPLTKGSKIFIAGHSLGAMSAPLVAKRSRSVSGIILLAGNARPLEDLVLEQIIYIFSLDSLSAEERKEIEELKTEIAVVKDKKKLSSAKAEDLPLGLTSYYWKSVKDYDQVATAKKLKVPVMVLQGERDYQVTMKDFEIWKKELGGNTKNALKSYPALNHPFLKGEGKSTPSEYEKQGNVHEQVILDITEWIKAH